MISDSQSNVIFSPAHERVAVVLIIRTVSPQNIKKTDIQLS